MEGCWFLVRFSPQRPDLQGISHRACTSDRGAKETGGRGFQVLEGWVVRLTPMGLIEQVPSRLAQIDRGRPLNPDWVQHKRQQGIPQGRGHNRQGTDAWQPVEMMAAMRVNIPSSCLGTDHGQYHLEPPERLQCVRLLGWHQDQFARCDTMRLAGDDDFRLALDNLDQGIKG